MAQGAPDRRRDPRPHDPGLDRLVAVQEGDRLLGGPARSTSRTIPRSWAALAGINLKANDWRKSIEWYLKVAEVSKDESAKVAAYQFIGNVAWSKLNSKTLTTAESVELADRGIGALQKAAELQPKNPKPVGLLASIFNFRALAMGASWAAAPRSRNCSRSPARLARS